MKRHTASQYNMFYKNIFLYSSLQYMGNVEEYFAKHTEKLVAFVVMPRQQYNKSLLRVYRKGKLVKEQKVILSKNIFMYYFLWYFYHIYFLFSYFSRKEKPYVITFHPISFFGMLFQRLFKNIQFIYWDGDYFPPVHWSLKLFEALKRYYNARVSYACYLSDAINKKMNGRILKTPYKKTVMWGILPKKIKRSLPNERFNVLFVGVIKDSQGLEFLFDFLIKNKDCYVNIIGVCTGDLYKKYSEIIKKNNLQKQIFFPNKFFSDKQIEILSKKCHAGIALYDTDKTSATYYTDPGKVKTYASLGLPIIMSNVSAIAPYVEKFLCGEVIEKKSEALGSAILKIKNNYDIYVKGLENFNTYFYYETYYENAFTFLEKK